MALVAGIEIGDGDFHDARGVHGVALFHQRTIAVQSFHRDGFEVVLANIRAETARSERLITRLLELSAIESRPSLDGNETDLRPIVARQSSRLFEAVGKKCSPVN